MRRALAVIGLVGLLVLAGCTGSGGVDRAALNESATYEWSSEHAVTVSVEEGRYQLVYDLQNETTVALGVREPLTGMRAVQVKAIEYRYPNGTVVGAEAITVERRNSRTVVTVPSPHGAFAYTAPSGSRSVTVPVLTNRSHEVILPPDMRVSFPLFGGATPGGYETTVVDDRVHLTWEAVQTERLTVEFYHQRDLLVYGGLVGLLSIVALIGVGYYRYRIRSLEAARESAGLAVDDER